MPTLASFLPLEQRRCPAGRLLAGTELARGYYEPDPLPSFDARVGVVFMPFRWDQEAPWLWLLATVGLSAHVQPAHAAPLARPVAKPSRGFELCAALREPETASWALFRRAWNEGTLAEAAAAPSILERFALIGQDFASWMLQDGDSFALGDHVQNASFAAGFPSALLIPPLPELLVSGLGPFDAEGRPGQLAMGDWQDPDALRSAGDHHFLQLAPLTELEYAVAQWDGMGFFRHALLATANELAAGLDASIHVVDLHRASRHQLAVPPVRRGP